jgi:SET domain-containing protein
MNIVVKKSSIQGKGVFAGKDFERGETIGSMHGRSVNFLTYEKLYRRGNKRVSCDPFQIGLRAYITLENRYNLINHSCDPNAAVQGVRTIVARKPIKKGEEITYDYSSTEWTPYDYPPYYTDGWPMNCRCGERKCRRVIACFPYLPRAVQKKYLSSKMIQNHILEKRRWPLDRQRCFVCEAELAKRKAKHTSIHV